MRKSSRWNALMRALHGNGPKTAPSLVAPPKEGHEGWRPHPRWKLRGEEREKEECERREVEVPQDAAPQVGDPKVFHMKSSLEEWGASI